MLVLSCPACRLAAPVRRIPALLLDNLGPFARSRSSRKLTSHIRRASPQPTSEISSKTRQRVKQRLFVAGINPFLPSHARKFFNPSFTEVDFREWLSSLNFGTSFNQGSGNDDLEITKIATGLDHTLFVFRTHSLDSKGRWQSHENIFAIGRNESGQLGIGYNSQEPTRGLVEGFSGDFIEDVACGIASSFIQVRQGDRSVVYSFGNQSRGQIGQPPPSNSGHARQSFVSRAVIASPEGVSVKQIAAGFEHCFLLAENGSLYGTGINTDGQLGNGEDIDMHSFTKIELPHHLVQEGIAKVIAGADTSAILTEQGRLWSFGNSEYGQAFHGKKIDRILTPKMVPVLPHMQNKFVDYKISGSSAILLDEKGCLYSAGFGALGLGNSSLDSVQPQHVKKLDDVVSIYAGNGSAAALTGQREIFVFGLNTPSGRLGSGSTENAHEPLKLTIHGLHGSLCITKAMTLGSHTTFLLAEEVLNS